MRLKLTNILNRIVESRSGFTIDTMSAKDSDNVTDFLDDNNVRYKKTGPKITIYLDRQSLEASTILSALHRVAEFDEL